MLRNIFFILSIYSVFLYLSAPKYYSLAHCTQSFVIFCVEGFFLLKTKCKYNLLNFEMLFTIGFAFVCYAYPMVYYNLDPYFSLFGLDFPEVYITKGTALATVAYSFLAYGFLKYPTVEQAVTLENRNIGFSSKFLTKLTELLLLVMLVSLVPVLLSGEYDMNWGAGSEIRGVMESLIFYTLFQKFYRNRGCDLKSLIKKDKIYFALVISYVLLSTAIGNRGNIIRIGLLLFVLFNIYIKKLSNATVLIVMLLGIFLMYARGAVRDSGSYQNARENSVHILDFGRDLIINNRSEYVLMDIADRNGHTYGKNFLGSLLSSIPYAQSTLLTITGMTVEDISSGSMVTRDYFAKGDPDSFGLGTNIVGDVYLAFGLPGVIFLFYLLGYSISKISYRANQGNPIMQYIYAILLMNSVIWIRADFFKPLQMVIWGVALYYFFDRKKILSK